MAEPFETLREVNVAIGGIRDQLDTYAKVFGAVVLIGLTALGFLYSKIDRIEDGLARNTAILERIEAKMDKVAMDTGAIRERVQTASAGPSADSFSGWVGVKVQKTGGVIDMVGAENLSLHGVLENMEDSWVFVPQDADD